MRCFGIPRAESQRRHGPHCHRHGHRRHGTPHRSPCESVALVRFEGGCPTAARAPFGQHEEGGAISGDALRFVDCSMCRSSPRASRRPAAQTSRASLRTASPPSGERIQLQLPPNSNSNPNVAATAFAHGGDAMLAMLAMPRSRASPLFFFHVVTLLRPRSQILRDRQHVGGVPAVRRAPYLLPLQSPPRAY